MNVTPEVTPPPTIETIALAALIYYDGININVDLSSIEDLTDVRIFDISGRMLINKKVEGKMIHPFSMRIKNEVYIVVVSSAGRSVSRKVLVY